MATYTLSFASDVDVTVDGVTVTSPYTLTKSCTITLSTMVNPSSDYYISVNGTEVLSETVNFADEDLNVYANTANTGRTLALNAVVNFTISAPPKVSIDVTTLSGYESLAAGTYQLGVKAKASGYADSDLSATTSFTKLAAPVVTAADTTVTWNAVPNAASYDIYVDNELWENTTGEAPKGYKLTLSSISLNAGDTVSIHMNNLDGTTTVASTLSSGMSWENVVSFWITDSYDGNKNVTINGTVDGMYSEANPYVLTKDTTLIYDNICLTGDMMVTLADGSEKQICDLTSDDTYIAYDLATGDLVTAPAKYFDAVDGHSGNFAGHYQKYTFDDGTVIKEVHKHRFLNLTKMEFINLCHWEIGDRIYKIDGTTPALVSKEIVVGMVEHFTVTTEKYHDGFVQGCLYGDRYTQRYKIQMVDGKPVYDFSKPHTVDYLYGELEYDD